MEAPDLKAIQAVFPGAFFPADAPLPEGMKRPSLEDLRHQYPNTCLHPCCVPTDNHPGACIDFLDGGKPVPVCVALAGHPGDHYCVPADAGRWERCPRCNEVIAKRALKGHIAAHDDKRTPEQREADNRKTLHDALEAFLAANPGWGSERSHTQRYGMNRGRLPRFYTRRGVLLRLVEALAANRSVSFWRGAMRSALRDVEGMVPPLDVRAARKYLDTAPEPDAATPAAPEDAELPFEELGTLEQQQLLAEEAAAREEEQRRAAAAAERAERQARAAKAGHVGQVGERIDVRARVAFIRSFDGSGFRGGNRQLVTFEVADGPHEGAVLKWWTDTMPGASVDDYVKLRATVKDHGAYQGIPETTVARVTIQAREVISNVAPVVGDEPRGDGRW